MPRGHTPRSYRKVARAKREEETRRRITEAAVELHGSVGPANTSITNVAKQAGVSRMTVYNHFPSEAELFTACSTHWASLNPFPDPSEWAEVTDVEERLAIALGELYRWYASNRAMLGNVFRDTPAVPALAEVMDELWSPYAEQLVKALARDWTVRRANSMELRAALHLAVDFGTWSTLRGSGLGDEDAARLVTRMLVAGFALALPE